MNVASSHKILSNYKNNDVITSVRRSIDSGFFDITVKALNNDYNDGDALDLEFIGANGVSIASLKTRVGKDITDVSSAIEEQNWFTGADPFVGYLQAGTAVTHTALNNGTQEIGLNKALYAFNNGKFGVELGEEIYIRVNNSIGEIRKAQSGFFITDWYYEGAIKQDLSVYPQPGLFDGRLLTVGGRWPLTSNGSGLNFDRTITMVDESSLTFNTRILSANNVAGTQGGAWGFYIADNEGGNPHDPAQRSILYRSTTVHNGNSIYFDFSLPGEGWHSITAFSGEGRFNPNWNADTEIIHADMEFIVFSF